MTSHTETPGLAMGATAPDLPELPATDGNSYSLASFADASVLVTVFISNGCPTVRAYEDRLADLHRRYSGRGVRLLAINANDPHLSPRDAYEEMVKRADEHQFPFLYLKDELGTVAMALGAICTPHAFVFDKTRRLRYQGRIDDARDPAAVTSHDLEDAVEALLVGRPVPNSVTDPFGCSIVW
jgi:peroxiredoxin